MGEEPKNDKCPQRDSGKAYYLFSFCLRLCLTLRVIFVMKIAVLLILLKLVEVEEVLGDSEKYPVYDFKYTSFDSIDAKSPGSIIGSLPFICKPLLYCNDCLAIIRCDRVRFVCGRRKASC